MPLDPDSVNDLKAEEQEYRNWQRQERNRILRIVNPERKQAEWNKVFPPIEPPDDSYLEGEIF